MSKIGYIFRYLHIVEKLDTVTYATYEELKKYIEKKGNEDLQIDFSKRTLQRDLKEIRSAFGIDIEYSKANKGYSITGKKMESKDFQRMLDAFYVFNSLTITGKDIKKFIHLEDRKAKGTENLHNIIKAIKRKFQIKFSYKSLWGNVSGEITQRTVAPYALKEFKNRWYLLAKDFKDDKIKTFALDRLTDPKITEEKFEYPKDYDVQKRFSDYFGIYNGAEEKPQEIVLLFQEKQLEYVRNLPLHHSQEVLDNNQVKLFLGITFDFVQELLSFGSNVKVLEPQFLIEEIKTAYKDALKQYK